MHSFNFPTCPICENSNWITVYEGPIRNGSFGNEIDAEIRACTGCGVQRLAENICLKHNDYETAEYRRHLKQTHELVPHFTTQDELVKFVLDLLWPTSLRGKVVADVGCGGGSLLDHLQGLTNQLIAVEPDQGWQDTLMARGYHCFPSTESALQHWEGKVDVVISTQVIEHVDDPKSFIASLYHLLKEDGLAIISTLNRNDILMELIPNEFQSFFYRTQHRWAFDEYSLRKCAELAGVKAIEVRHVHRYGISNTVHWLKDKQPRGSASIPVFDNSIDQLWQLWLETNGYSDNLSMLIRKED
tara:strand:- start:3237 stop:4139 length:903 start_codon:yes stop_codon:yes gene_type:complete